MVYYIIVAKKCALKRLFEARDVVAKISRRHVCHLCKRERPMPCRLVAWWIVVLFAARGAAARFYLILCAFFCFSFFCFSSLCLAFLFFRSSSFCCYFLLLSFTHLLAYSLAYLLTGLLAYLLSNNNNNNNNI